MTQLSESHDVWRAFTFKVQIIKTKSTPRRSHLFYCFIESFLFKGIFKVIGLLVGMFELISRDQIERPRARNLSLSK